MKLGIVNWPHSLAIARARRPGAKARIWRGITLSSGSPLVGRREQNRPAEAATKESPEWVLKRQSDDAQSSVDASGHVPPLEYFPGASRVVEAGPVGAGNGPGPHLGQT